MDTWRVGFMACLALFVAGASVASAAPTIDRPSPIVHRSTATTHYQPWVEGVDPTIENRLFYATYGALQNHNVLKVYVFDAGGYESAGIRFSGRIPHESRDLAIDELAQEAVMLIRTTFDEFPAVQQLDVWATIPVSQSQQVSVENTVFSVSADRATYEALKIHPELSDYGFLNAFGRVWVAPQVPR